MNPSVPVSPAGFRPSAGETADPLARLESRIAAHEVVVGVIGLGYVGLPLSCAVAEAGLRVIGFDVDPRKIRSLARGESYLRHLPAERIARNLSRAPSLDELTTLDGSGAGLYPTTEMRTLGRCDVIVLCVPTPLSEGREPDLSFVEGTARTVAERLRPGQLVVLESTTWPGTTAERVRPILEGSGLTAGVDFALAYSPEREDPGNRDFPTETIPKVVGGLTPRCGAIACDFYSAFLERVVPVSDTRVAEASKLLENIFRAVNIALVNELKMLFDRMGIDVWEVIEAASTKPFGFMPFYPGPGLGGHCIPIDPFYLTWKARHYDFVTRFIELAGEINTQMPYWVVERIADALGSVGCPLRGSKILVLGVAYKKDVDDLRDSPALKLLEILEERGAEVSYNDPWVPSLRERKLRHYEPFDLESVSLTPETLRAADCVLLATDHSVYDMRWIAAHAPLLVDTRNASRVIPVGRDNVVKA